MATAIPSYNTSTHIPYLEKCEGVRVQAAEQLKFLVTANSPATTEYTIQYINGKKCHYLNHLQCFNDVNKERNKLYDKQNILTQC